MVYYSLNKAQTSNCKAIFGVGVKPLKLNSPTKRHKQNKE